MWWGHGKPKDSNTFLKDFVTEATELLLHGFEFNNNHVTVVIDGICCDAPAKSFVLKTKGHTGLNSCSKCTIEGEYLNWRTVFAYTDHSTKRTHADFVSRTHEEYHISETNTILPNINIIDIFPLDYMHLTCLGVMRKLVLLWMNSAKLKCISTNLSLIKKYILIEFCRKPRDIQEINRWKATELRQLLLYTGPIVLKNILTKSCYTNFMCLNISMIILLSSNLGKYLNFANILLRHFVRSFGEEYGTLFISHNIHGVLHLVDEYRIFGPLDNSSCFPFENFMKTLKKMIRKPDKPLEQVVKRYNETRHTINKLQCNVSTIHNPDNIILKNEHKKGPLPGNVYGVQYNVMILELKGFTLKINQDSDSYFGTNDGHIVKVFNIVKGESVIVLGKYFTEKKNLYETPIKSSKLGIFIVNNLSSSINSYCLNAISRKYILFHFENEKIAMPLFHTE